MERRVRGNSHARCGAGENSEIISKSYLSLSHAVCYAVVAYQTAYLKAHYPQQYMAALMTSVLDRLDKISVYINECKDLGIPVLPPDINHSEDPFVAEGQAIRFGLGAVKNVGRGLIRSISAHRAEDGPFRSLEDFIQRMGEELNKRAVENFIKCGAMDCFGYNRSELLNVYENMMDSIASSRRHNLEGQLGLFGMLEREDRAASIPIPPKEELSRAELMLMEKETTGIYLSGHPMDDYRRFLKNTHVLPIGRLMGEDCPVRDDEIVSVAGIVQTLKMKSTRNHSMMAYVIVEDGTASIEMLAFSKVISEHGGYLRENAPVVVTGRLSIRDDKDPQIIINRVRPMTDYTDPILALRPEPPQPPRPPRPRVLSGKLYLKLPTENCPAFRKVKAIVNMFPGESEVVLYFADTKLRRGSRCQLTENMLSELKNLLGTENVVLK